MSVVIPTYNRAALLPRAIRSVESQTYREVETIIVDDGSTDGTDDVVSSLRTERLRYIRHGENRGASAARNTGIDAARGDYIAFLDSDDEWLPKRLEAALELFGSSTLRPLGVVTCGHLAVRAGRKAKRWIPRHRGWVAEDLLLQRPVGIGNPFLVLDAALLNEHGIRFDTNLPAREEWDFIYRFSCFVQLDIVREPLVVVHHHPGPRLWTADRALRAGAYLHGKFHDRLLANPRAHSRFHLRNALTCLAARRWRDARLEVKEAIAAMPRDWIAYLWYPFFIMPEGSRPTGFHTAAARLLRRITFGIT